MRSVLLTVHKTTAGAFDATGHKENIPCNSRLIKYDTLSLKNQAEGDGCAGTVKAGDAVPTDYPNSVLTAMVTTEMGPVWVSAAEYDHATTGFFKTCDGCCNE